MLIYAYEKALRENQHPHAVNDGNFYEIHHPFGSDASIYLFDVLNDMREVVETYLARSVFTVAEIVATERA